MHKEHSAFAVISLLMLLLSVTSQVLAVSAQGEPLQLMSATYYIVQGDSDLLEGHEAAAEFSFLEILSYKLPYDIDRVYANVPSEARNVTTWVASKGLINSTNGRQDSGPMAGQLYVDVPAWFERSDVITNSTNVYQSLLAPGSALTNITYESGSLHLLPDNTSGVYISAQIPVPECVSILSANLTLFGTDVQSVASELSNDGGSTWTAAVRGSETPLSSTGTSFHVRLMFQGNESTPLVTGFQIAMRYLLPFTTFTVHITYLWPGEFTDRRLSLDLTEPVPYVTNGSSFVFLYVLKGYSPEGTGIALSHNEDGDPEQPGKDFYVNMSLSLSGIPARTIQVTEPEQSWVWLIGLAILSTAIVGGAYVIWRRKPVPEDTAHETVHGDEGEPRVSEARLSERKAMLAARKAELSARMDELSTAKTRGTISSEGASEELEGLRTEFKKVRNELNRLSKKKALSQADVGTSEPDDSYESLLASIARLDEDFEKGRLTEKTYQSLRTEYKSRATEMLAARPASESTESPLSREKSKLIEAIMALEDERDRGEIDDKVCAELQASYKKELADVLRQIEESEEE